MNTNDPRDPWQRLVAAARPAHLALLEREASAPFGFATRIAARAFTAEQPIASLFERFSLRALGIACLLMLTSLVANYSALASVFDNAVLVPGDPVAETLDVMSS